MSKEDCALEVGDWEDVLARLHLSLARASENGVDAEGVQFFLLITSLAMFARTVEKERDMVTF